jgi:hypothetical protein
VLYSEIGRLLSHLLQVTTQALDVGALKRGRPIRARHPALAAGARTLPRRQLVDVDPNRPAATNLQADRA